MDKSKSMFKKFECQNKEWLATQIDLPTCEIMTTSTESLNMPGPSTQKPGRPPKEFFELSDQSKRRKVSCLVETTASHEELMFAARLSLQKSGKRDAAKLLKELETSPKRASK